MDSSLREWCSKDSFVVVAGKDMDSHSEQDNNVGMGRNEGNRLEEHRVLEAGIAFVAEGVGLVLIYPLQKHFPDFSYRHSQINENYKL